MADDTVRTIPLKVPLTDKEGGTIGTVTLRRVKVKDIKAMEKTRSEEGDIQATIVLISRLSGLAVETVEEIDAEDFTAFSEVLANFLPKPPPDGM